MDKNLPHSHRYLSSDELDLDAYLLDDESWMLFAYVKDPQLVDNSGCWKNIADRFTLGKLGWISGAVKTEKDSAPIDSIAVSTAKIPDEAWCVEKYSKGELFFRLETSQVLNPGLFLDQRLNRTKLVDLIAREGQGAALNLFSYTGSFSMAAIMGGVSSSTSVDVSARYLGWEKKNFEKNFSGVSSLEHRVLTDDARDFLRRASKKPLRYQWIIIDPPTFSRSQGKIFRVQKEMQGLIEAALQVLAPRGRILASTNDSRWADRSFYSEMEKLAHQYGLKLERGSQAPDFGKTHPLKSVWLLAD